MPLQRHGFLCFEGEKILLLASKGEFFMGPADFFQPFTLMSMEIPVSGMGDNVIAPPPGIDCWLGLFRSICKVKNNI